MSIYRAIIKILNAVLGFFLLAFSCSAQSVSSDVIGTAGNEMLTPNIMLSYTIGEPCVMYWNNGSNMLTEGFQQNEVVITTLTQTPDASHINIYPNPFTTSFTVEFDNSTDYELTMTDALGRSVDLNESKILILNTKYSVDMQNTSAGIYFLNIMRNHQPVAAYRLVKSTP